MAEISIGDAVGEGFKLIGRKPLAVLAWGAVRMAASLAPLILFAPLYLAMMGEFGRAGASHTAPNPGAWAGAAMQTQGLSLLINIVVLFLSSVLICAVNRAVIKPEQGRYAYLRVGMAEVYVFVFFFAAGIAAFIGVFVALIPIGILVGILAASHAVAAAVVVGVVAGLALLVAAFWVACRLALVSPMIVDEGQLQFSEAWRLTKGHALQLFLVGLLLVLMLLAAEIVIGIVLFAVGAASLGPAMGGFDHAREFFARPPAEILQAMIPLLVVAGLLLIPISGAFIALMGAPWARAYLQLRPERTPMVAATFA